MKNTDMKKLRILAVIFMLAAVCCLSGCLPTTYFRVISDDLPENESLFILLRPQENDTLLEVLDDDIRNSAIGSFEDDGWVIAERVTDAPVHHYKSADVEFQTKDDLIDFCEKYKSIRVARCSDTFEIIDITNEFPIVCSDKFAVVSSANYHTDIGTLESMDLFKRHYFGMDGFDLGVLMVLIWIATVTADIWGSVAIILVSEKKREHSKFLLWLVFGFCSIGHIFMTVFYLVTILDPYYNIDGNRLDIINLVTIDVTWVMSLIFIIIGLKKSKKNATG